MVMDAGGGGMGGGGSYMSMIGQGVGGALAGVGRLLYGKKKRREWEKYQEFLRQSLNEYLADPGMKGAMNMVNTLLQTGDYNGYFADMKNEINTLEQKYNEIGKYYDQIESGMPGYEGQLKELEAKAEQMGKDIYEINRQAESRSRGSNYAAFAQGRRDIQQEGAGAGGLRSGLAEVRGDNLYTNLMKANSSSAFERAKADAANRQQTGMNVQQLAQNRINTLEGMRQNLLGNKINYWTDANKGLASSRLNLLGNQLGTSQWAAGEGQNIAGNIYNAKLGVSQPMMINPYLGTMQQELINAGNYISNMFGGSGNQVNNSMSNASPYYNTQMQSPTYQSYWNNYQTQQPVNQNNSWIYSDQMKNLLNSY